MRILCNGRRGWVKLAGKKRFEALVDEQKVTAAQVRGARGLLGWSQQQLAEKAGLVRRTIASIEAADTRVSNESLGAVRSALENEGVVFTDPGAPEGVSLRA
jgi:DNA-binding XRE family transcriptional regulator